MTKEDQDEPGTFLAVEIDSRPPDLIARLLEWLSTGPGPHDRGPRLSTADVQRIVIALVGSPAANPERGRDRERLSLYRSLTQNPQRLHAFLGQGVYWYSDEPEPGDPEADLVERLLDKPGQWVRQGGRRWRTPNPQAPTPALKALGKVAFKGPLSPEDAVQVLASHFGVKPASMLRQLHRAVEKRPRKPKHQIPPCR